MWEDTFSALGEHNHEQDGKLKMDKTGLWKIEGHGSDSPVSCQWAPHIKPPQWLDQGGVFLH